ncbi:secreted aspartic proteinase [Metarhizium album ARSEF 1941]|uniref:Secreted aspartic proteinase n=1 Tax=Metarhizium album (strain ARSEF 1941) TaxID=1081103 RepID=A0A0B2WVZ0_METAS|nr:secreted aspartic proteinase [Metarhizium album ARSEF 1941]KHO00322.1 secreted aspartic proteinase [Metarhizium album ARSEF 1941]
MDNRMVQELDLIRFPLDITAGAPTKNRRLKRQNEIAINPEKSGFFYSIELQVGTPAQAVRVNFDTGSAELWINPVCSKSTDPGFCEKLGRFNGSQTFVDTNTTNRIGYGTGFAKLDYGYDYVQIGSAKISQQMFGVATDSEFASTGILGASPQLKGWKNDYPLFLDNLAAQGFIKSRAFSLDIRSIESKRGFVVFGGIDTKKFSGPLEKRPIIPAAESPDKLTRYWIYLDGVSVTKGDGSTAVIFDQPNGQPVLLDSGYTVSALPTRHFNKIKEAFPDVSAPPEDDKSGLYRVPCDVGSRNGSVDFKFGKTKVVVPYNDFIWKQPDKNICVLGVTPDDDLPVLGDTFLRGAYAVFDQDNRNIHLANHEDCGSRLVAIGTGPDAVPSGEGDCGKSKPTTSSAIPTRSLTTPLTMNNSTTASVKLTVSSSSVIFNTTTPAHSTPSVDVPGRHSTVTSAKPLSPASISTGPTNGIVMSSRPTASAAQSVKISVGGGNSSSSSGGGGSITPQAITTVSGPLPNIVWQNVAVPLTYTSIFITTSVRTITSCPHYVTGCPTGSVTTETMTGTTTWCPGDTAPSGRPRQTAETVKPAMTLQSLIASEPSITSVFTTTETHTITSCSGQGSCKKGHVTTEVITSTTHLCPESTATFTISRTHTCREDENGCEPGDETTTVFTVTIEPHTTADRPTPAPGCGDNCVLPPPAPTSDVEAQPRVTGVMTAPEPTTTIDGTNGDMTASAKPVETACSTCGSETVSPPLTAGASGSRAPAMAGAIVLAALSVVL